MDGPSLFEACDLWKPSVFSHEANADQSLFPDLEHQNLPSLPPIEGQQVSSDISFDAFVLPPLDVEPGEVDSRGVFQEEPLIAPVSEDVDPDLFRSLEDDDPWNLDFDAPPVSPTGPTLHTWEAFQLTDDAAPLPKYLSEAGGAAFDALMQRQEKTAGVVTQNVMLRACCSLVLGRSSAFFQWSIKGQCFKRTLENVPLSGLSGSCTNSILEQFMDFACPALVALRYCIATVLEAVEQHTSARARATRSLLSMQSIISGSSHILQVLASLVRSTGKARGDEEVIASLADLVTAHAESGSALTAFLQQLLLRVSAPWLQQLAEETGLSEQGPTLSRSQHIESEDLPESHVQQNSERPRFIPAEDWRLLEETKANIKLLARHLPSHKLPAERAGVQIADDRVPALKQVDPTDTIDGCPRPPVRDLDACAVVDPGQKLAAREVSDMFDFESLDDLPFELLNTHERAAEAHDEGLDALHTTINEMLDNELGILPVHIANEASDLLAPLRTELEVWSRWAKSAVLSCVFEDHKLQGHLELHRSFHLCGSGDFVTRLTTALFSGNTQSAERKRGNIPTGQTMGLRLESREGQRWPPASSELRLTLLSVLSDAYGSESVDTQLPGGLSFAIRELSDAEIDQVMDPTSIHALGFLRLQYTPPEPLADFFTPDVVQKYDSIFRVLLIHLRILHTTQRLSWHCSGRKAANISNAARRFAWKARHFVATLSSYILDVAIDENWRRFMSDLAVLDPAKSTSPPEDDNRPSFARAGILDISRMHFDCLEAIRSSMFVRRKHADIRMAIDEALGAILKGAATVMHGTAPHITCEQHENRLDEAKTQMVRFVTGVASKLGKDANDQRESDSAKLLLKRLALDVDGVEDVEGV